MSLCGYYLGMLFIDDKRYGRRNMQQVGFAFDFLIYLFAAIVRFLPAPLVVPQLTVPLRHSSSSSCAPRARRLPPSSSCTVRHDAPLALPALFTKLSPLLPCRLLVLLEPGAL